MIVREKNVANGKRVIVEKACDGFFISMQEHESICGGFCEDANKDGWRKCLTSFEYTLEAAEKEMERLASRF